MAAQHNCVLLASDYESQDEFAILVSALVYCKKTWNYPVRCSLTKSAIEVVLSANQVEKLDCILDINCDPLMDKDSIYQNMIISADEVVTVSEEAKFQPPRFDLANYKTEETEGSFKDRLAQLLVGEITGGAVILTPSKCVKACFEVLGQNPENVPVFSLWVLDTKAQTATIQWLQETKDELKASLQGAECFVEVPPEPLLPTRKPPEGGEPPAAHPPQNEAINRISTQLLGEIRLIAEGEIPPTDDPTQQLLLAVTYALKASREEINQLKHQLEEEKKKTQERENKLDEELKRAQAEIKQAQDQLQTTAIALDSLRQNQGEMSTRFENHFVEINILVTKANEDAQKANQLIPVLQEEIRKLKAVEPPSSPIVPNAHMSPPPKGAGLTSSFPLSILSTGKRPEGNRVVAIGKNLEGECSGYVTILKSGECFLYSPDVLSFTGMDEIDISGWARLEPGSYELVVLDPQWQNALSEKYPFTIYQLEVASSPAIDFDSYKNSFLHANLTNLPQCEEYVKTNLGEAALLMFQRLVTEWKNPSWDLMSAFVEAVMTVCNQDEMTAKTTLVSQGFQF